MQRRVFLKKSGLTTIALATLPPLFFNEEKEYSILELMGKEDIKLYGKGINLQKEAHDAFLEMKKGTDIDVVDGYRKVKGNVLNPDKFAAGGPYEDFKNWMETNSEKFGFYLVYTNHPKRKGFKYEPWHYSYAPISRPMLTAFRRKNILLLLQQEDFYGSEHFTNGFVKNYIRNNILDINKDLL